MTNGVQTANTTKTVKQLLEHSDKGELVLPEIQRDFVWTRSAIRRLFDSLYRGLPIGNLLVWNTKTQQHVVVRSLGGRKKKLSRAQPAYGYLLDGQQRLTAISRVRDADDEYPLMFYVWPDRDKEDEEPFYWRARNDEDEAWCVPVSEILSDDFSAGEIIRRLQNDEDYESEDEERIRAELQRVRAILDRSLGIIEFVTDDYALATELFIRFNSTGTKLRSTDLTLAELAKRIPSLTSDHIRTAQSRWAGFHFTLPFVVQCLIAVRTKRLQLREPKRVWKDAEPEAVKAAWKQTERAFALLVEFLTTSVQWRDSAIIPTFSALIPLVYILASSGPWSLEEKRLARRWLLLASVHRQFSGSAQTELDTVLRRLGERPSVKALWKIMQRRLRRLRPDDFNTGRVSGPVMALYLSYLRDKGARDWRDADFRLDGTVAGHGAALHVHHFFPRALLRKRSDIETAEVNTFANYTVIAAKTNLNVSSEEPASYVDRLDIPQDELVKQCIPLDPNLWRSGKYREFLRERRKLLAERANAFLGL